MKIRLKKDKQKELIFLAKGILTWREFSSILDVNCAYLSNDLKYEKILLSDELYTKLVKMVDKNFDKFIIERLGDNWGRSKGGLNSKGSLTKKKSPAL